MDIEKEREAFEIYYIANHHDGDIHPNQQLLEWSEKGEFYFATSVNDLWDCWLAAKQQAVPKHAEFYLGGGVFAICDWSDFEILKSYKWNTTSRKSRTKWVWAHDPKNCDERRNKVAMHNLIMNPPDGFIVDHINGDGLDNRRSNLRIVTAQQNSFNSVQKGGSSIYKGVSFEKCTGMWRAYISKDGKRRYIGRFQNEDDAARSYDKEASFLFGEYAKLNFPSKAMIQEVQK